jgi:anaerobic selenocysteine-containing dehydrogenase
MNHLDAADLRLSQNERVLLRNEVGRLEARVFIAPIARGNLQVHWPEGNVLIRRGLVDAAGGVPDYNSRVSIEKLNGEPDPKH